MEQKKTKVDETCEVINASLNAPNILGSSFAILCDIAKSLAIIADNVSKLKINHVENLKL